MNIPVKIEVLQLYYSTIGVWVSSIESDVLPLLRKELPEETALLREVENLRIEGKSLYAPYAIYVSLNNTVEGEKFFKNAAESEGYSIDIHEVQDLILFMDKMNHIQLKIANFKELLKAVSPFASI